MASYFKTVGLSGWFPCLRRDLKQLPQVGYVAHVVENDEERTASSKTSSSFVNVALFGVFLPQCPV